MIFKKIVFGIFTQYHYESCENYPMECPSSGCIEVIPRSKVHTLITLLL